MQTTEVRPGGDEKAGRGKESQVAEPAPRAPTPPKQNPVAAVASGGSWGEAGGFPKAPQRQTPAAPRGPIFIEAIKDPVSIILAVALAGVMGGVGAYLGWRLGSRQEGERLRGDAENRVNAAKAEFEQRQKGLDEALQGGKARLAELERANAALEAQAKDRDKAGADAKAALGALQEKLGALQQSQTQNEEAARRITDLMALRTEQEILTKFLREAVGDEAEVGTDGPYVFVRPKTKLYADNSNRPAEAVIGLMKKVAAFAKTYEGPYRLHVEGHTDASPGPTAAGEGSNLHAGAMRALDIAGVLVEAGIPASRMTLLSQGEAFPLRTGKGDDSMATNRRVELIFAPTRTVEAITVAEPAKPAQSAPPAPTTPTAQKAGIPRAIPVTSAAPAAQAAQTASTAAREPVPKEPAIIRAGTAREPARPHR